MLDVLRKKREVIWDVIAILLAIIWMVVIFILSECSAGTSSEQSGIVVEILKKVFNISFEQPELLDNLTVIVRKCAHAFEYFVLGILFLNIIRQFWLTTYKKKWVEYWYLAVIGAFLYAVADEVHQAFVPGRSCELCDIIIDTIAACIGVGMVMLLRRWCCNKPSSFVI